MIEQVMLEYLQKPEWKADDTPVLTSTGVGIERVEGAPKDEPLTFASDAELAQVLRVTLDPLDPRWRGISYSFWTTVAQLMREYKGLPND